MTPDATTPDKPRVVYFHRYPIEVEALQYAAARPLIDRLLERYDVIYLSMHGCRPPDSRLRCGLRVEEIPLRIDQARWLDKWLKTALYYLRMPWTLRRLKQLNPAVIICKETLPFVPVWVGRLGKPMLIAASDWWWSILLGGSALGRRIANALERREVRQWNAGGRAVVIANSQAEARLVERWGMAPARVRVINAPCLPGIYQPCPAEAERRALGLTTGLWVVAIHGIIRPGKGYGQMLEWWRRLAETHANWRLLIIGGAGGEKWCRSQIHRLKLASKVIMTGWLPSQADVNRYLNAADCLLVIRRNSPDNEGIIPSALYHSLATGKPTVATRLAGMAEVIRHGVSGYLFEPDNYDSFRAVLEYVAGHPAEAARVGQAGFQRGGECFDPQVAAEQHVQVIDALLAGQHSLTAN